MNIKEKKDISPESTELKKYKKTIQKYEEILKEKSANKDRIEKEIYSFEKKFIKIIGRRYEILDELDYRLKDYMKDNQFKINEELYEEKKFENYSIPFKKIEELEEKNVGIKDLYKNIVKEIHPDKSTNEEECRARTDILKEINVAYSEGNKEKMMILYEKWKYDPEYVKGDTVGEELVFTIRKMYKMQNEIEELEKEITELRASDLFMLKSEVEIYSKKGYSPLKDICISLDNEIKRKKQLLRFLQLLEQKSIDRNNRRR